MSLSYILHFDHWIRQNNYRKFITIRVYKIEKEAYQNDLANFIVSDLDSIGLDSNLIKQNGKSIFDNEFSLLYNPVNPLRPIYLDCFLLCP